MVYTYVHKKNICVAKANVCSLGIRFVGADGLSLFKMCQKAILMPFVIFCVAAVC